jgi:hypothetical protein
MTRFRIYPKVTTSPPTHMPHHTRSKKTGGVSTVAAATKKMKAIMNKKGKKKKTTGKMKRRSTKKANSKKRMSRAERLTHYSNLILNLEARYHESVTHEQKLALAKELIKALKWEMKHKNNKRTETHM